jgi:protocatechuate 3,4-dioxygenase beta subunit
MSLAQLEERLRIASFFLLITTVAVARSQNAPGFPQENSVPSQGFKIAGTVVNAMTGAPLGRARVSIANTRVRAERIEMMTDESGHFEFTAVPAGKYSLQGTRRGYVTSTFDQHEQFSTAIVTGADFSTDKLVLRLTPLALVTGHVLDESGEGVRDAQVQLFREDHSGGMSRVVGVGRSSTDDRGYFDFPSMRPGTYFISATGSPWYAVHPLTGQPGDPARISPELDVTYPTTYYGGATDSDGASAIELKGGQTQEVEIRLAPVPALHFTLRVPVEEGETNVFRHPVLLKRVFDSTEFPRTAQTHFVSPGVIEVSGLAAGRYDVNIRSTDPVDTQRFSEIDLEHDGQDLNATDSETMTKLTIKLRADALPKQYGVGLRDSRQKIVAFAPAESSGQLIFPALRPGKYAIVVPAQGKFYAVKRVISPAGETAGHDVTVSSAEMEITAELTEGVVTVEGVVSKAGKPTPGIMVALVPNDPEAHLDFFRRDQSDFDGTFSLRGVIPGTYTVVAVEDAWGFDWLKAGVLARYVKHGQAVVVGEKLKGAIHLPEPLEVQPK